jgi:hypothetical protein
VSASIGDDERREDLFERAAWAEADPLLAHAWREAISLRAELQRAQASFRRTRSENKRQGAGMRRLTNAVDQVEFLLQFIERAVKLRRMQIVDAVGAYDPALHVLSDDVNADPGSPIRVDAPAVVQTRASGDTVMARAIVSPAPSAPMAPRKRRSERAS